jgi:hypothetical protein
VGRKFLFSLCLDDGPSLPVGPVGKSPSVAIGREFHERQSTQSAEKRKPYSWLAPLPAAIAALASGSRQVFMTVPSSRPPNARLLARSAPLVAQHRLA